MLVKIARLSLWNRRVTALLTILALSVGVALLLGIHHLRHEARASFEQTLSGTDLLVGPPGGRINLLLSSIFQMGPPERTLSAERYHRLVEHPMVAWAVPIALGDTVQGFPVFATQSSYFEHYQYGSGRSLALQRGRRFAPGSDGEVVLGATVARTLGHAPGDQLVVAHGAGKVSFAHHEEHPMTVVGVLAPTGTPVDRRVHMTLAAMTALHQGTERGAESRSDDAGHDHDHDHDHGQSHGDHSGASADGPPVPGPVNAVLLGLKARPMVFALQRELSSDPAAPLTALIPGVTLTRLWQMVGVGENLLYLISFLVLLATLAGMMTMLLASMGERRRELAILRTVGAGGATLFCLIELEVLLITGVSLLVGTVLLWLGLLAAQPWLAESYGLFVATNPITASSAYLWAGVLALALLMGLAPAVTAYRRTLSEGLNTRV